MLQRLILFILVLWLLLAPVPHAAAQTPVEAAIWEIQGNGAKSPMLDQLVKTTGVVTIDLLKTVEDGFFLQSFRGDADPATSDGIWIFDGNRDAVVKPGDLVEVTGHVAEHYDLTEIQLDTYKVLGETALPEPTVLDAIPQDPAAAATYLEAREGMLVKAPPMRVVGATNDYGDVYALPDAVGVTRLYLPDREGRLLGLMFPATWTKLNHGDLVEDAVGAMTYTYGIYRVAITAVSQMKVTSSGIAPPKAAPSKPDELRIGTYNLLNFFDTVDDPDKNDTDVTLPPAIYAHHLALRALSIGEYLGAPDVLAVEEVEHQSVLDELVAQPVLAYAHYKAKLIEGYDLRGIDVGFLYNQSRLELLSAEPKQACTALNVAEPNIPCTQPNGQPGFMLYSRPPLAAHFKILATGGQFTVVANHFKSKSGGDAVTAPVRTAMAENNLTLLKELQAERPGEPVIILGDLNDFVESPPIRTLVATGKLRDLHERVPPAEDYTFIFNGISQVLDHILVEPTFWDKVSSVGPVHINTDFADSAPDDVSPGTWRASDHDPMVMRVPIAAFPTPVPTPTPAPPRPVIFLPITFRLTGIDEPDHPVPGSSPMPSVPTPSVPPATPTAGPPIPTQSDNTPQAPTQPRPSPSATTLPTPRPTATPVPPTTPHPAPPRTPLRITKLFYDGTEPRTEGDEYVEITNISAGTVTLTGWTLVSVQGNQVYHFPDGLQMAAGQACRVYTNQDHPESCGLNWHYASGGIWRNMGDKAELRDASDAVIDWWCFGDYAGQCG